MKHLKNLVLIGSLFFTSCAYSSSYGPCIGLMDKPDPELNYKVSVGNAVWTVIGFELVIPPIVWAATCVKCPTGVKQKSVSL